MYAFYAFPTTPAISLLTSCQKCSALCVTLVSDLLHATDDLLGLAGLSADNVLEEFWRKLSSLLSLSIAYIAKKVDIEEHHATARNWT